MRDNSMHIVKLKEKIDKMVTPTIKERRKVNDIAEKIITSLSQACIASKIPAEITLEGSIAKDTWVSGEADIDIFLQIPPYKDIHYLEFDCLKVIRDALPSYTLYERYADHPYLETIIDEINVNIVPCFQTKRLTWLSAADRTPFHTRYLNSRLNKSLRREIRILKKFLMHCKLYGADAMVRGFSGFLCELLVVIYGSFEDVITNVSQWKSKEFIDLENIYKGRVQDAQKLFQESLIIIDPIDHKRNVAAAVADDTKFNFVAACRLFRSNPHVCFFISSPTIITKEQLQEIIVKYKGDLLTINLGQTEGIVDVVWSQLRKTEKLLKMILKKHGFKVIQSHLWSNDKKYSLLFFKLESCKVASTYLHLGPPVEMDESSNNFLNRHLFSSDTSSGPWIESGRWMVEKIQNETSAIGLLNYFFVDGGLKIGLPSNIMRSIKKGYRIMLNEENIALNEIPEASHELFNFVMGRPSWLEIIKT